MRKWTSIILLALCGAAVAQQPAGAGSAPGAAPAQKKEIKDPNEYTAYMNARQETDDNAKAAALEGFVSQYPNSVVKVDALEQLMAAYEKTNNVPKLMDAANRVLQADPGNIRALALLAYLKRQQASSAKPDEMQKTLSEAADYGQRGLQAVQAATKQEGMSDADFQKLKTDTSTIFNGAVGFAALQTKDYASAQTHLQAAVDANPANLADVYPLAVAYLAGWPSPQVTTPPPTATSGIWYLVRAASIAPDANQKAGILKYGRSLYIKYHGGDDGWDALSQQAASSPKPPADFAIKPAPTPAEQAAKMAEKPAKDMTFDEFEFIFTSGNQAATDKVWEQIKDKPIAFEAKVQSASATKLTLSASAEDIDKNMPDVELTMTAPIPAKNTPKVGGNTAVSGTPVSYTAKPFMMILTKGALVKQ